MSFYDQQSQAKSFCVYARYIIYIQKSICFYVESLPVTRKGADKVGSCRTEPQMDLGFFDAIAVAGKLHRGDRIGEEMQK